MNRKMNRRSTNQRLAILTKQKERQDRAKKLILPTYPNEYGTTALVDSDFARTRLVNNLAPYNTTGRTQVFFWKSVSDVNAATQAALSDTIGTINFRLSNFPGYTDLTNVFDSYRIRAASVEFMPANGVRAVSGSALSPRIWTIIDYDDSTSATRSAIQQYDTCTVTPPDCGVVRTCVPAAAIAAYGGGAFTNYGQADAEMWMDSTSPSIEFYGVKYAIEAGLSGQTILQSYSITVTCFWEFRSSR